MRLIADCLQYIQRDDPGILTQLQTGRHLIASVDYRNVVKQIGWLGSLCRLIANEPQAALHIFSIAISHLLLLRACDGDEEAMQSYPIRPEKDRILVRLLHYSPVVPMKELKTHLLGKFVAMQGTVARLSSFKLEAMEMHFRCATCQATQTIVVVENTYATPTSCDNEDCRSRTFLPLKGHKRTKTRNWQRLKLQERTVESSDIIDSGRIPRTIECDLSDEMVDSLVPGDVVTVAGIVKRSATEESVKQSSMYSLYIDVNAITKVRSLSSTVDVDEGNAEQNTKDGFAFSTRDLQCIQQISREPDLFNQLVNSLCPSIFGHEIVKG